MRDSMLLALILSLTAAGCNGLQGLVGKKSNSKTEAAVAGPETTNGDAVADNKVAKPCPIKAEEDDDDGDEKGDGSGEDKDNADDDLDLTHDDTEHEGSECHEAESEDD